MTHRVYVGWRFRTELCLGLPAENVDKAAHLCADGWSLLRIGKKTGAAKARCVPGWLDTVLRLAHGRSGSS